MTDHITKPFDPLQLNTLIHRHAIRRYMTHQPANATTNAAPTLETQAPVYRFISLKSLLEFSRGKNDFVVKMLRLLLEQTPPAVQSIGEAIGAKDFEAVRALAHKMKPNINLMGNAELDRLIQKLEKDAETSASVDSMPGLYADFRQLYNSAMDELRTAYNHFNTAA